MFQPGLGKDGFYGDGLRLPCVEKPHHGFQWRLETLSLLPSSVLPHEVCRNWLGNPVSADLIARNLATAGAWVRRGECAPNLPLA